MKHRMAALAFVVITALSASAQVPNEIIKLTIHPSAAPSPALKYQLFPDLEDQTPGNAALLYYRACSPEWLGQRRQPTFLENVDKWKQTPLKELPLQELKWLQNYHPLRELDRAARREYCDWEMTARLRQEALRILLPELQTLREFANLLALRCRIEMAEGHYDKAVYTLETGFALARHLSEAPLVINNLVGIAIGAVMVKQMETLMQAPDAPNLYWAIATLPRPLVPIRKALQGEKFYIFSIFPSLHDIETRVMTPEEVQRLGEHALRELDTTGSERLTKTLLTVFVLKSYPEAKRFLIQRGFPAERVEAMPALQVVLIYSFDQLKRLRDDLSKWTYLPYWQAVAGLRQSEQQCHQSGQRLEEGIPFASLLVPATGKIYFATARLERLFAALACIEAIKLYAAAHEGKFPPNLSDITEVPVPIDPITGKNFEYKAIRGKADLYGPPPAGEENQISKTLHYELTLSH